MAISFKGKWKKFIISLIIVLVLELIGGGLTATFFGPPWPGYVVTAISSGYAVWLAMLLTSKKEEENS